MCQRVALPRSIRWWRCATSSPFSRLSHPRLIPDAGASRLVCPMEATDKTPGDFPMLKRFTVCILMLAGLVTMAYAADQDQNACKGNPNQWQQLFNGKDLTGWKHVGPGGDTVEDGLIRTHGGMGLLYWTGGKIGNCMIHVVYKMRDENDNS